MSKKHVILVITLFFIGLALVVYCFNNNAEGDELIDCDTKIDSKTTDETNDSGNNIGGSYDKSVNDTVNTSDINSKNETESDKTIYVHICGEVREPGVYEIKKKEARVIDAIEAADGLTKNASTRAVNQAEIVTDGQQIYIPSKEEEKMDVVPSSNTDNTSSKSSSTKVNINTASEQELITLPGIGSAKALDIIDYRAKNGSFSKIEDIMKVPGIKEGLFNKISENITV